jgi:molybdopterin biosynthesis enzyme
VLTDTPKLRPITAVLAELRDECRPAAPKVVSITEAVGQVLVEDLVAPAAVPREAMALRAGFAVASQDLVGVSAYAPLILANAPPLVEAGDHLPLGCDAVLPQDGLLATGAIVEIVASVMPGENVCRAGEDARAGQVLRRAGQVLRPIDAAAAAAAGIRDAVTRSAALLVLSDKDNIEAAHWLATAPVAGARARVRALPTVAGSDWHEALTSANDDMILVLAHSPSALLEDLTGAARIVASGLALRGAETALVALAGPKPLVVAPPRLDAIVALTLCLLGPFVDFLTERLARPVWRRAPLSRKLASNIGLTEVALVRETESGLEPLAIGSLPLAALGAAEGYLVIPPESEGFQGGERVEAYGFE